MEMDERVYLLFSQSSGALKSGRRSQHFHVPFGSFVCHFFWNRAGQQTRDIKKAASETKDRSGAKMLLIGDHVDASFAKTLSHIER
jgi:hypothetical protein